MSVDLRCPVGPRKLLGRLRERGQKPTYVDGNLIELACVDCRNRLRREGGHTSLVLHRFNILGELCETEIVP